MARVPILHGALVLLRDEAEHRSSAMEAVVLFSEEARRICHVRHLFRVTAVAKIHLHARAAEDAWANVPSHTRSLLAQVITAVYVPSRRPRTPW